MTVRDFLQKSRKKQFLIDNGFKAVKLVSCEIQDGVVSEDGQELLLRLAEQLSELPTLAPVIKSLLRSVGLYPYLEALDSLSDAIAKESHRIEGVDKYFHREQFEILQELLKGRNVMLSAPTSFGKSLIIDAVIASGRFKNIAIIVPTIALMEETRRRIQNLALNYKVITQLGQQRASHNIFVMTQERILEYPELSPMDFFAVDEFYKLHPRLEDAERSSSLNHAFYKLLKTGAQYYLLGPCIEGIHEEVGPRLKHSFVRTDFSTVVTELHKEYVNKQSEIPAQVIKIWSALDREPTLIYAKSPNRVDEFADALVSAALSAPNKPHPVVSSAADFLRSNYSAKWTVANALEWGVGVHHGKLPRSIAQFVVSAFNDGYLHTLICTSTLIEGVNTTAKNVIIADRLLGQRKYDYFTFNNIRGRSGRMFKHFVGRVFILNPPPKEELPSIDIPIVSQPKDLDPSFVIAIDAEDRSEQTRERFAAIKSGARNVLPLPLLQNNIGVDPRQQVELARELMTLSRSELTAKFSWKGVPTSRQLNGLCEIIFERFVQRSSCVRSAPQLAYRIRRLSLLKDPMAYLLEESNRSTSSEPLREALDFLRTWASYKVPRFMMVVDSIQNHILTQKGLEPGDYSYFSGAIKNWFIHPALIALEEYGLPLQVSKKIVKNLDLDDFDVLLASLKKMNLKVSSQSPFETYVIRNFQDSL